MNLWLLRPVEDLPDGDNPWEPWYDKNFGFVIRAETEDEARAMATECAGDERYGQFSGPISQQLTITPWLLPKYSTCVAVAAEGDPCVIIVDYRSA